jgi:hypothetical protein
MEPAKRAFIRRRFRSKSFGFVIHFFQGGLKKRAPIIKANLRIWCEYWGVFDRIDGIKLLSTRQLKKI